MTGDRYLLDNRAAEASDRFAGLAAVFDDVTHRQLEAVGIGPGWRCWEVGAGGPSVPTWMAEQVEPDGSVLATDIDVSWLATNVPNNVAVRTHDVADDDPPEGPFHLVHSRLVLVHVPGRSRRCAAWRECFAQAAGS